MPWQPQSASPGFPLLFSLFLRYTGPFSVLWMLLVASHQGAFPLSCQLNGTNLPPILTQPHLTRWCPLLLLNKASLGEEWDRCWRMKTPCLYVSWTPVFQCFFSMHECWSWSSFCEPRKGNVPLQSNLFWLTTWRLSGLGQTSLAVSLRAGLLSNTCYASLSMQDRNWSLHPSPLSWHFVSEGFSVQSSPWLLPNGACGSRGFPSQS